MMWTMIRRAALAPLFTVALTASVAACSTPTQTGPTAPSSTTPIERPASTATVAIASPKNGEALGGSSVPLRISLEGGEIVQTASMDVQPDEGHLHVILDDQLISMTSRLRANIPDVQPGSHVLRVEFVASDHAPFNPRVVDDVTFEVGP